MIFLQPPPELCKLQRQLQVLRSWLLNLRLVSPYFCWNIHNYQPSPETLGVNPPDFFRKPMNGFSVCHWILLFIIYSISTLSTYPQAVAHFPPHFVGKIAIHCSFAHPVFFFLLPLTSLQVPSSLSMMKLCWIVSCHPNLREIVTSRTPGLTLWSES